MLEHKYTKVRLIRSVRKNICTPLLRFASRLFGNSHFCMHSYGSAFKARIPIDVLLPHRPIMFEGIEFPGPADPQKYCEVVYGNFMDLPPVDKRDHHLVTYKIWD